MTSLEFGERLTGKISEKLGEKLSFLGFAPKPELLSQLVMVVDRLQRRAPSDAFLKFAIEKKDSVFRAVVRVVGQAGEFLAEATGDCPATVVKMVEEKIKFDLDIWKRSRS